MRFAAEVSYVGRGFYGWQIQSGLPSVQGAIENALSLLNGSHVDVAGAGRTDAGVHARAQVCSFELDKNWEARRLLLALNANLPDGVSAMRVTEAAPCFHARFDATSREYRYFIWHDSAIYPHLKPNVCWIKGGGYDWGRATAACKYLEGEHDFGVFCRAADRPENAVRTLYRVRLMRHGCMLRLHITGNGFLTNMVRIIMGCLERVAKGEREPEWIAELLASKCSRDVCGRTFPPEGLFLWKINYNPPLWN